MNGAKQNGFTLIEVLVALGIVAVALLAGLRASDSLVQNAQRLSDVVLGQLCIENQFVHVRLTPTMPDIGESSFDCEQAGHKFSATMIVTATPNPSFRRVDALVKDGDIILFKQSTVVGRY